MMFYLMAHDKISQYENQFNNWPEGVINDFHAQVQRVAETCRAYRSPKIILLLLETSKVIQR